MGTATGFVAADQTGVSAADLNLGTLQNNGGNTLTFALLPGSIAIDTGDNALLPPGTTTDQRAGAFTRIVNGTVDVGAYEYRDPVATTTTVVASPPTQVENQPVVLTATVTPAGMAAVPIEGTVTFTAGGVVLGTAPVEDDGVATLITGNIPVGTQTITATYNEFAIGDFVAFTGSSATTTITITPAPVPPPTPTPTPMPTPTPALLPLGKGSAFGAGQGGSQAVLRGPDGTITQNVTPFGADFTGGVRVASGDFNGDGTIDLVAGTGPGSASLVRVLDGKTGAELFSVAPFEATFTGGVFVTAGDINQDGVPELIITPDQGGGPRVQVFDGVGFAKIADFFGITDPTFRGGARAGIADINGDGFGDLIVSAGFGGGPRVAVWTGTSFAAGMTPTKLIDDIFVFEDTLRNGAFVAGADINGDGFAELIAGAGPDGGPRVVAFDGMALTDATQTQTLVSSFFAGDPTNRNGVPVAVTDYDGDGTPDLLAGTGEPRPGSPDVGVSSASVYPVASLSDPDPVATDMFEPFPGFVGGVFVG